MPVMVDVASVGDGVEFDTAGGSTAHSKFKIFAVDDDEETLGFIPD